MTPLLLKGSTLNEVWGGTYLNKEFGVGRQNETISAILSFSVDSQHQSIVKSGEYSGLPIREVLKSLGNQAIGKSAEEFSDFPVNVKIINSRDRMPMEVSNADRVWYIIDCVENAKILSGFNRFVPKDELEKRISKNNMTEICRFLPVNRGDCIFIPAGTIYAAGRGIVFAEISENKGNTFCVNDYGREYTDGSHKLSNIKRIFNILNTNASNEVCAEDDTMLFPFGTVKTIGVCESFISELLDYNGNVGLFEKESFSIVLMIDGKGVISYPSGNLSITKGDCVFIPSNLRITISGSGKIINVHL